MDRDIYNLIEETAGIENVSNLIAEQEEEAAKATCTDRVIGNWLADFPMSLLMQFLSLSDTELEKRFHSTFGEVRKRTRFSQDIRQHINVCPRCSLLQKQEEELALLFAPPLSNHHCGELSASGHA